MTADPPKHPRLWRIGNTVVCLFLLPFAALLVLYLYTLDLFSKRPMHASLDCHRNGHKWMKTEPPICKHCGAEIQTFTQRAP